MNKILKWIRKRYGKLVSSIAFLPAVIAICFLLLSWVMLEIDYSAWGKHLKLTLAWLSLKDASTARVIISTIVSGIMSLTVFSFSMVMIVLNQAASQMSNRILSSMIENRFQQIVLGFYIGAIVYALFLLSTIRDINSGIYVPALSIYLLIIVTVVDIFLFIYFLDYVTQTVKYETVIQRVQMQTLKAMERKFDKISADPAEIKTKDCVGVTMRVSGYFQSVETKQMLQVTKEHNIVISFMHNKGAYLIKGTCLLLVYGAPALEEELIDKILLAVNIYNGQPIETNPDYGFNHLSEVAVKALSPGINDPGTAVLALNALADLFSYRLHFAMPVEIKDESGRIRIIVKSASFKDLFEHCVHPIWHYGKSDRFIQNTFIDTLDQLKKTDVRASQAPVFDNLLNQVKIQMEKENY